MLIMEAWHASQKNMLNQLGGNITSPQKSKQAHQNELGDPLRIRPARAHQGRK